MGLYCFHFIKAFPKILYLDYSVTIVYKVSSSALGFSQQGSNTH
jgi:hypothetical protein